MVAELLRAALKLCRRKMIVAGNIVHIGLWSRAKHIAHLQVYSSLPALRVLKGKIVVAGSLANLVEWRALPLCHSLKLCKILLLHNKSHPLLALIPDNLLKA